MPRKSIVSRRSRQVLLEALDTRTLFAISLDNGWSVITPDSGVPTRQIFVAANGNDGNSGLAPNAPVASLSKGMSLLRNNTADQLLLRAGDTFLGSFGFLNVGGFNSQNPIVISSYTFDGSTVRTGVEATGLTARRPKVITQKADTSPTSGISTSGNNAPDNFAIVGLELTPRNYVGTTTDFGISLLGASDNVLIEDNYIHGYFQNIAIGTPTSPVTYITVRRNVITDAYTLNGNHPQGLYASGSTERLLIEQNVFDHNGWRNVRVDAVTGAVIDPNEHPEDKTVFRHQMYINTGAKNVTVQYNITSRGSLRGVLLRAGGNVDYNLIARMGVGAQVGNTDSTMIGNVVLEGQDLPGLPAASALDNFNVPNLTISNNIVAHDKSAFTSNVGGITVGYGTGNATVTDNIVYDWRNAYKNYGRNVSTTGNQLEVFDNYHPIVTQQYAASPTLIYGNNKYYNFRALPFKIDQTQLNVAGWTSASNDTGSTFGEIRYLDPNRTLGQYNGTLIDPATGQPRTATYEAWIAEARLQSKNNWRFEYTAMPAINYIREGFNAGDIGAPPGGDRGPTIEITALSQYAFERTSVSDSTRGNAVFRISRGSPGTSLLTVYFTVSGTATYGQDYTIPSAPLRVDIPAGQSFVDITIRPVSDFVTESPPETVIVTLSSVVSGSSAAAPYTIGSPSAVSAIIKEYSTDPNVTPPDPGGGGGTGGTGGGGTGGGGFSALGTGLRGSYYNNDDLTSLITTRTDSTIDFNYGNTSPASGVDPTTYSVEWNGQIQPEFADEYKFYVKAAYGVRLYIKDTSVASWTGVQPIIDRWTNAGIPGDANRDDVVNSVDFNTLVGNFGRVDTDPALTYADADFNSDNKVDTVDFNMLMSGFGQNVADYVGSKYDVGEYLFLLPGRRYDIKLQYRQTNVAAKIQLAWDADSFDHSVSPGPFIVPSNRLYVPGAAGALPGSAPVSVAASGLPPFSSTPIDGDTEAMNPDSVLA